MADERICFVISPIGDDGSETRHRADQVFRHVIQPAVTECGYKPLRADQLSKPGLITSQIIQYLLDADIVVADLAGHNPNVFYELAIRHAVQKPVMLISEKNEKLPFDVAQNRAIMLDHRDLDSADYCRRELIKQIKEVEKGPSDFNSPISTAINIQSMRDSDDPLEENFVLVLDGIAEIRSILTANIPSFDFLKGGNEKAYDIINQHIILALELLFRETHIPAEVIDMLFKAQSILIQVAPRLDVSELHPKHPDYLPF